jgi:hypothetical protein
MEMARGIEAWSLKRCLVHDSKLERRQLASSRRKNDLAAHSLEGEALTVHLHTQPCLQDGSLSVKVSTHARVARLGDYATLLDLEEGRDLRHIDQVAQLKHAMSNPQTGIVADAKIA